MDWLATVGLLTAEPALPESTLALGTGSTMPGSRAAPADPGTGTPVRPPLPLGASSRPLRSGTPRCGVGEGHHKALPWLKR